jgi:hypothetical protein
MTDGKNAYFYTEQWNKLPGSPFAPDKSKIHIMKCRVRNTPEQTAATRSDKKLVVFLLLILSLQFSEWTGWGQVAPEPMDGSLAGQAVTPSESPEPGLLFYLSGDHGFTADYAAGGQVRPNFLEGLKIIPDGAIGKAFQAGDDQLMSYWAPGNIYAQRGTLSFFWRSRYPVGPTPFPIFRVAFADHTSWDMVWLRIDYNGSGFDAFVTDVGLARTRVSHYMDLFPGPEEWTHLAFSWDETEGMRLYVNGEPAGHQTVTGKVYDTGLDQFGPHSRIISPYQVQSLYSFKRGGDLDELRIYDCMLSDSQVEGLSRGEIPEHVPALQRDLNIRRWRDDWWDRHGWNLPHDPPPPLPASQTVVKKIGIHEAYDVKRWNWKANDGIRETTWPGVYNMSRLPGRYDYFVLPDWDCYSMSGQTIKFHLPDEPWNHVEVWGKAWGQLTHEKQEAYDLTFAVRKKGQVKSFHRMEPTARGGILRFDNALIEEPIGELGVYYVHGGSAPQGSRSELFRLESFRGGLQDEAMAAVLAFIDGRYPADERTKMIGMKQVGGLVPGQEPPAPGQTSPASGQKSLAPGQNRTAIVHDPLPFIHMIIPYENNPDHGLDGVEIEIPALPVRPTHDSVYPMNIRVKDPIWPMRDLADFSFSVTPGTPHMLWMDTRDRVLPGGSVIYITLAGAGKGLTAKALTGAKVRLVYKTLDEAKAEHELDRFTQIRDLFGFTVEEHPSTSRLNLYNRFIADHADLMRVNPDHWLGQAYMYAKSRDIKDRPDYEIPPCPAGVPEWAFLQVEYLRHLDRLVTYYIDHRQVSNGEFGGGLSDDDDFTNFLVGTALMGIRPEKTRQSLRLFLESYYDQDRDPYHASLRQRSLPLFTNGLATITTDQLHAYEEGIEAVGQLLLLDYGDPLYISRGMEIAKQVLERVTQIAPEGHRHFRSRLFGGTSMSTEDPWQWSDHYSYNLLHTPYLIARYNGNPSLRQMIIELADGLLEHRDEEGKYYTEVNFSTGETRGQPGLRGAWQVLLAAYDFTGDQQYRLPIKEQIPGPRTFNPEELTARYAERIRDLAVLEYLNTKGSIWIDRISANTNDLQTDRLGGVALARISHIYPQHFVSWNIKAPADHQSLAMFVSSATPTHMDIIAFNLEQETVRAAMALWAIKPGQWKVVTGIDTDDDQRIDRERDEELVYLERGIELDLSLAPRKNTLIQLELEAPAMTVYEERPDLAICQAGIEIEGNEVTVRVYSQGATGNPETTLELKDAKGEIVATAPVPAMKAPLNLKANWMDINMSVPPGTDLGSGSLQIDPEKKITQITPLNSQVIW